MAQFGFCYVVEIYQDISSLDIAFNLTLGIYYILVIMVGIFML